MDRIYLNGGCFFEDNHIIHRGKQCLCNTLDSISVDNILKSKEYSDAVLKISENNKSIDRINNFIKNAIDNNIGFIQIPVKSKSIQSLKI